MATVAMVFLAGSVALGYFTIAMVVAPRIKMPSASSRVVLVIRGAAVVFFIGCGMTHVHILLHTLGVGTPQPVEAHEFVFHGMQAVGAWLFILGAILRLELHVVPSRTHVKLHAAVEQAEQAQQLASTDELTGLARRWIFDKEIDRQVDHARRYGTVGALVLIDVDGLKSVNDTHGHPAGDDVLRHVADSIQSQLRATDIAARIGGDEFAVILPEAGSEQAQAVAERFVAAVRDTSAGGTPHTSVSSGIASIDGTLSPAAVMKGADIALYEAKRGGGDTYEVSRRQPQSS